MNQFWNEAVARLHPYSGFDTITLDNKQYIILTSGTKSSSGYSIKVHDVKDREGYLLIEAEDVKPRSGATLAVFDYPAILLVMDRTELPIRLRWVK
ncbi:protease complex subunit PrcB family protein [Paenibacillus sp. NPDC056579]|uniref:protease complex subunit PrcB family protein n=1 Tax=Paenibacillus sp. NPDC056579 TaxID=3345871 RepID=UPI0036C764A4